MLEFRGRKKKMKKTFGILVVTLLIAVSGLHVVGTMNQADVSTSDQLDQSQTMHDDLIWIGYGKLVAQMFILMLGGGDI